MKEVSVMVHRMESEDQESFFKRLAALRRFIQHRRKTIVEVHPIWRGNACRKAKLVWLKYGGEK